MSLSELNLKKLYQTRKDDIVHELIEPALRESCTYDRGSGYFSLSVLASIAKGLVPFIKHRGKIRIITSVELSEKDIKLIQKGLSISNSRVVELLHQKIIETISDETSLLQLDVITNLIAVGQIQIKVAYMPDGIYHEKIGIFSDYEGNKIYFSGSANATVNGLTKNWENILVLTTWQGDREIITDQQKYFDNLWSNHVKGLEVIDFPEAEKRELFKKYKISPNTQIAVEKLQGSSSYRKKKKELFEYQKVAVLQFLDNNGCHFFEMATGTGKTFTAIRAMKALAEKCSCLSVIILVPQIDLQTQWDMALQEENIKPYYLGGYANASETDYNFSSFLITSFDNGINVCISTYDTFFLKFANKCDSIKANKLLVVDEAHNLSPKQIELLPENFIYRLGLSATPERYDQSETDKIIQYFTRRKIEPYKYTIEEAIRAGYLSHYLYYPILVNLSNEDFLEYQRLTKQVIVAYNEEPIDNRKISDILTRRSSIIKKCNNKISKLDDMVSGREGKKFDFHNSVVYCGQGKDYDTETSIIDSVTKVLAVEGSYSVSQFTAKTINRAQVLKEFENNNYDVLVAIRCFDEGVDVPKLDKIFIMASDTLTRQTVQRRGRVLRKCKETGKKIAYIYDFIVLPPEGVYSGLGVSSVISNELRRAYEYARLANNAEDVEAILSEILNIYGVEMGALENECD